MFPVARHQVRPLVPKLVPQPRIKTRAAATWLPEKDYDLLVEIAKHNGVNVATYLRAIINDALAEEGPKVHTLFSP